MRVFQFYQRSDWQVGQLNSPVGLRSLSLILRPLGLGFIDKDNNAYDLSQTQRVSTMSTPVLNPWFRQLPPAVSILIFTQTV
jgi:hypothetical protein